MKNTFLHRKYVIQTTAANSWNKGQQLLGKLLQAGIGTCRITNKPRLSKDNSIHSLQLVYTTVVPPALTLNQVFLLSLINSVDVNSHQCTYKCTPLSLIFIWNHRILEPIKMFPKYLVLPVAYSW